MYKSFFKRVADFVIALSVLAVIWPVLAFVALWLHFANQGAGVFFTQRRPGRNGKIFKIIKFKTMTDERDASGNLLEDAKRLTRAGRFVRSASIDELPQLLNVLKGDMALIGPRPLLVRYLPYYTERENLRHSVRPGITGLAQVSGRNALDWNTKLELDVQYAEQICLSVDAKILVLTCIKVVSREGAFADKKENYLDIERKK